jgi:hypothetical protein
MTLTIGLADPAEPGIAALLAGLHALYDRLVPSSEEFILDVGALKRPDIRFFAARVGRPGGLRCAGASGGLWRDKVDVC